ncbi:MAG: cytochrome c peroxidase [Bacteroidota bacterium]
MSRFLLLTFLAGLLFLIACKKDDSMACNATEEGGLLDIEYDPSPYNLVIGEGLPVSMPIPTDNPLTVEGVELGRHLFYDPILSVDSSMSCATCHNSQGSFTDNLRFSPGVDGIFGKRSAMSLLDLGFNQNGFFWGGGVATLEQQALMPITDPIEMHNTWDNVIEKFQEHPSYPQMFRRAFGIETREDITKELAAKAIAQFERILISSGNSLYDRAIRGEYFFSDAELNGYQMFFDIGSGLPDAECGHCHNIPLFTTNEYTNNGLQEAATLEDFKDKGHGLITGDPFDNGTFRIPTLRNITKSAPYMHDGSLATLEEVIEHYNSGGKHSPNKDGLLLPLGLTEENKRDLLAFLKMLEDPDFNENPAYSSPFD